MTPFSQMLLQRPWQAFFYAFSQNFFLTFAEKSDVLIGVLQHNQTVKKSKKKKQDTVPPLNAFSIFIIFATNQRERRIIRLFFANFFFD